MRYYKERCEALAEVGAFILTRDGFTEKGLPVYVTRKVIGDYELKQGRGSIRGIIVDHPFADGSDRLPYGMILGTNIDGEVTLTGLHYDMGIFDHPFTDEEKEMILSDAKTRLKMAHEPKPYNAKAKAMERLLREINQRNYRIKNDSHNDYVLRFENLQM